jgi:uncharacterized membrane protein YgdD (TMEM256/DUF423 family)
MKKDTTLLAGAILGALAVAVGAFGAHSLKSQLTAAGRFDTFETAVRYQFYHVLALLVVAMLMHHMDSNKLRYSALFFLLGIIFFSGSLYALCLSGITAFGAVTPFGGMFFIIGWILLGITVYKK